jgi:adenylylsulfate kinase
MIIWLTGIPASGKTTLAKALAEAVHAKLLDGDEARALHGDQDFSREGRCRNVMVMAVNAIKHGGDVVVACVSPYRRDRRLVRYLTQAHGITFVQVYVACPPSVAWARDPKGLYRRARAGEIAGVTGWDAPYDAPTHGITVQTDLMSIAECVDVITSQLEGDKECPSTKILN